MRIKGPFNSFNLIYSFKKHGYIFGTKYVKKIDKYITYSIIKFDKEILQYMLLGNP